MSDPHATPRRPPLGLLCALPTVVLLQLAWAPAPRAQVPGPEASEVVPLPGLEGDSLHVVVGPADRKREPVAVDRLRCERAPLSACSRVTEILRNDLLLSFFFDLIPARSHLADPAAETLEKISWEAWTNVGARFLIKGELRGPEPYAMELRLYNVTRRETLRVDPQSFQGLADRDLRRAAHRFINGVLAQVTGTRGVFGSRLAYDYRVASGVKAIATVDMDGAGRETLVSNGSINMLPSWGFGGVLYTSFVGGKPEIYFGKRRLSSDRGHYRKVAVSPDGSTMVASISYGGQSDLFLLSKGGERLQNLTKTASDEVSPTFSPDGSQIAFVSSAAGGPQIFVMGVGGGGARRLTHAGTYNYAPDWGPGGLIAFAGLDQGVSDLFTVDLAGNIRRLTQGQGSNKDPSWSPDGRYLAFVSRRSEGSGIYLMSADGRYQRRILAGGALSNVAWRR